MKARSLPVGYLIHVYYRFTDVTVFRRWEWEVAAECRPWLATGRAFTKQGAHRAAIRAARTHRRNP